MAPVDPCAHVPFSLRWRLSGNLAFGAILYRTFDSARDSHTPGQAVLHTQRSNCGVEMLYRNVRRPGGCRHGRWAVGVRNAVVTRRRFEHGNICRLKGDHVRVTFAASIGILCGLGLLFATPLSPGGVRRQARNRGPARQTAISRTRLPPRRATSSGSRGHGRGQYHYAGLWE